LAAGLAGADFEIFETIVHAIDEGPVGKCRGEAHTASLEKTALAPKIEIAFVLPSKAHRRQVLAVAELPVDPTARAADAKVQNHRETRKAFLSAHPSSIVPSVHAGRV
jgi:hypothetical protein